MNAQTAAIEIEGFAKPAFGQVKDTFARNFTERGEVGAAVAVFFVGPGVVHEVDLVIEHQSLDAGKTYDAGTYPVLR